MRLIFEPIWSWSLTGLAAILLLVLMGWTYPRRLQNLPPVWQRILIGLRLLTTLVLIFAMLRPAVEYQEPDQRASRMLILCDASQSMTTPDMPGGITRREALLRSLRDQQDLLARLGEEVELQYFDFATELQPISEPAPAATGSFTALGAVIQTLREQESAARTVGVILLGDGAQRVAGSLDIDPRSEARRLAADKGIPLHTVVYGTSELAAAGLDLAIEDLSLDQPVTFERKTVPVRMKVRLQGAAGQKIRVQLLLEDRTGKALGEAGELKPLPLTADSQPFREIETRENSVVIPVELSFTAEQAGEFKLAAEVVPLEREVKTSNNRLETLITVRAGGLKVAYFDVYRPEQRFLRRLNETAKIQLDFQLVLSGKFATQTKLDPQLFQPGAYDAYIIGDIPASVFQDGNRNYLTELAKRVNEGAGLAMIGGLRNFSAGGYADGPLAPLLPVRLDPREALPAGAPASAGQHYSQKLRILPTRDGENHYLMRLAASGNDKIWRALPRIGGANRLTAKSGAVDVLAESEEGIPLLFASDTGRGRVLALAVDETWKWHLHGYGAEHQRFWQQVVLWLTRKEFDSEGQVWARVEPRNFPPLARVPVEMGVRDDQGAPIPDADYRVELISPQGEPQLLTPQRSGDQALAEITNTFEPGDYWVRVNASRNGNSLGPPGMARFIINSRDIEMENPTADPDLMQELAAITGGSALTPEEFGPFLKQLLDAGISSELLRRRRVNLWDHWALLITFLSLMTAEWTIRKLRGLV
jgi:uncharacterized membrane protein